VFVGCCKSDIGGAQLPSKDAMGQVSAKVVFLDRYKGVQVSMVSDKRNRSNKKEIKSEVTKTNRSSLIAAVLDVRLYSNDVFLRVYGMS